MTYTLTHSPDGDYEIVTDDGWRAVAFSMTEALTFLIGHGYTLHPEHASIANALGVAMDTDYDCPVCHTMAHEWNVDGCSCWWCPSCKVTHHTETTHCECGQVAS